MNNTDDIGMPDRPPLSVRLTTGQVVKMTYGLEMDLRRMLPDPASAMAVALNDPYTQDYIIRRCMTTGKTGMVTDEAQLETVIDLEPDDTEALIVWAVNHVLYFFVIRAKSLANLSEQYKIPRSDQLPNGSTNSPSTTPSAGPLG